MPPLQIDEDDNLSLSQDDIKTLKDVARYWKGINAVSEILSTLGSIGKWLMYAYAVYIALRLGVLDKWLVGNGQ